MEFPHLVRLMAENQFDTIYHEHFSYFSLPHGREDLRGPRADALRRRGAADPRRLAADLRPPRGGRGRSRSASGSASCASARRARGPRPRWRPTRVLRRAGQGDEAQAPRVPDRRQARGQDDRAATARPGKGNTLLELLRHPDRFPRLHRRPQSLQAGQVPARHPHPDLPPGPDRGDAARTTSSSCPGTSRTRSWGRWPTSGSGAASSSCQSPRSRVIA